MTTQKNRWLAIYIDRQSISKRLVTASFVAISQILGLELISSTSAFSQIAPDNTLSIPSQVNVGGNTYTIEGGTAAGGNLFHSFEEFSVPTGREAFFNNATNIENILTRVTGGNLSRIDGLIRANGTANLFLLNPNGLIFGPNARLDIGGSFFGTTADRLVFENGLEFSATSPEAQPLLAVNVPVGLQFDADPAPVQVQAPTLAVAPGRTLALVGGHLNLDGAILSAPGGRIELGGLSDAGTLTVNGNHTLSFPSELSRADVSLDNGTRVEVTSGGGGTIAVSARNVNLSRASQLRAGLAEGLGTAEAVAGDIIVNATGNTTLDGVSTIANEVEANALGRGGRIELTTGSLSLTGGSHIDTTTRAAGDGGQVLVRASGTIAATGVDAANPEFPSGIATTTFSAGNGGDVRAIARDLTLSEGGQIRSLNRGNGLGGNIVIEVSESIVATGINALDTSLASGIVSFTSGTVEGGDVNLSTGRLTLSGGADVASFVRLVGEYFPGAGTGNGGDVTIEARESIEVGRFGMTAAGRFLNRSTLGTRTYGGGDSGNVNVSTSRLRITEGGTLSTGVITTASSAGDPLPERGMGNAGNVTVDVSDSIELVGFNVERLTNSDVSSFSYGSGNAGNVSISTPQLEIRDGAFLITSTFAYGNAGQLTVNADSVFLGGEPPAGAPPSSMSASAKIEAASVRGRFSLPDVPTGDTSELTINANRLTVTDGTSISVQHEGTGNAGQLQINAGSVQLGDGGTIAASAASGRGGNVVLNVPGSLVLRQGSEISAEAGGRGDGGNLTVNANTLVTLENSNLVANAFEGRGGNIEIGTQGLFQSPESRITASSQLGVDGVVAVTQPEIDTSSAFVQLSSAPIDPATQVVSACEAAANNTFVVTGNGGLPPDPTDVLRSQTVWTDTQLTEIQTSPSEVNSEGRSPSTELDSLQLQLVEATEEQRQDDRTMALVSTRSPSETSTDASDSELVEATQWRIDADGTVELISDRSSRQAPFSTLPCLSAR
ncbi:Putative hemagglutinin-related protein [Geitlerinema sp. FC II]|nr:Putative hemagglutinin-related protein [Geitlerinema sp. FC II]